MSIQKEVLEDTMYIIKFNVKIFGKSIYPHDEHEIKIDNFLEALREKFFKEFGGDVSIGVHQYTDHDDGMVWIYDEWSKNDCRYYAELSDERDVIQERDKNYRSIYIEFLSKYKYQKKLYFDKFNFIYEGDDGDEGDDNLIFRTNIFSVTLRDKEEIINLTVDC